MRFKRDEKFFKIKVHYALKKKVLHRFQLIELFGLD